MVSEPTPYYSRDGIMIYHGDCRDILPNLLPVGCVVTDPPFFLPVAYHAAKVIDRSWPRSVGDLAMLDGSFREIFKLIRQVLRDDGQAYFNCDGQSYPVFFACSYPLWDVTRPLIWYKPTGRVGTGWIHAHELILHCANKVTVYAENKGRRLDIIGIMPVRTLHRQHPAEKPGALIDFVLEAVPPNEAVLDPFCGTGTTLLAAKKTGRRAIGIEIEEKYCEIAVKRLAQEVLL